jgi:hypothetical protein
MKTTEKQRKQSLENYYNNREKKLEYYKNYKKNKDKEIQKEYDRSWAKNNILRKKYHSSLFKISGYTYEEFETHLLKLGWKPGLHIDHKIPVTHFSPDTPIRLINDLRNLQILTLKENSTKLNTYRDTVDKEYYKEIKKYLAS